MSGTGTEKSFSATVIEQAQSQIEQYQEKIKERQGYAQQLQHEFATVSNDIQQLVGAVAGLQNLISANQSNAESVEQEEVLNEKSEG